MKALLLFCIILIASAENASSQSRYNGRHDTYRGRYRSMPRATVVIPYRNYNYHYSDGYFYRPFGASLRIVIPPVGIFINVLPGGYRTVPYPGGFCYYYNGTYYRANNNRYEVIEAPTNAEVPGLLANAKPVIVNNEKLYELNGTYYKEEISNNGDISYKVVGKNGETTTEKITGGLQVGDTIEELPAGSKAIVINDKKLYVSPSGLYFEEIMQQDSIVYKVVGNQVN